MQLLNGLHVEPGPKRQNNRKQYAKIAQAHLCIVDQFPTTGTRADIDSWSCQWCSRTGRDDRCPEYSSTRSYLQPVEIGYEFTEIKS